MARGNTSTPQPPNELELLKAQVETLKESVKSLTTALGKKRGTEPTLSFDTLSIEHTGEYHKFGSWMDTFLAKLNRWKIDDVPLRRVLLSHDENLSEGFDDSQAGAISSEARSQVFDLFSEVLAGIPRATYNSFKKRPPLGREPEAVQLPHLWVVREEEHVMCDREMPRAEGQAPDQCGQQETEIRSARPQHQPVPGDHHAHEPGREVCLLD